MLFSCSHFFDFFSLSICVFVWLSPPCCRHRGGWASLRAPLRLPDLLAWSVERIVEQQFKSIRNGPPSRLARRPSTAGSPALLNINFNSPGQRAVLTTTNIQHPPAAGCPNLSTAFCTFLTVTKQTNIHTNKTLLPKIKTTTLIVYLLLLRIDLKLC